MATLLIILFILVVFYIIPAFVAYLWVRHKFKTEWTLLQPGIDDFIMVLTPLLNIGVAVFGMLELVFESVEDTFDSVDNSKVNQKIKNKQTGKKFFRL